VESRPTRTLPYRLPCMFNVATVTSLDGSSRDDEAKSYLGLLCTFACAGRLVMIEY